MRTRAARTAALSLLFFVGALFAAAQEKKPFDLPADTADAALRRFATQAKREVIFAADAPGGVKTNAVRGEFTPEEAVTQLLAGTGLKATQDAASGAFMINRAAIPNARGAAQPVSRDRPGSISGNGTDEVLTLNPFVITADDATGYTAANTLAGTRLNTPLNEVGTSISVVTREFLGDLAAHDSGTLLTNTVGTEVGGMDGNFAGGVIAGGRPDLSGARTEPERNQRVRGLVSAELTRNSVLTDIPFDAYNTERVTINRGPNALLFGIGSPGGVIDNTSLAPIFGSNFAEAKIQLGQRGSHRETLDLNRELIPRRLAVRLAALNDRAEYRQRPAWKNDERIYAAATAVLAENRRSPILGATTLRANVESGKISSNPPNPVPASDGYSSWWSLPSRELQRFTGTVFPAFFDDGTFTPRQTLWDTPTAQGTARTTTANPYFLQLALVYPGPGTPTQGLTGADSAVAGGQGRILWTGVAGRQRYDVFATQHAFSAPGNLFPGFNNPSILDRRIFDSARRLYSGDTNYAERDFLARSVTLEQAFWRNRAGLEVNYDHQRYHTYARTPLNGASSDLRIDISRYLGNGQLNPNLGRPYYVMTGLPDSFGRTEREAVRATGFVTLDARELLGDTRPAWWFGRHTVSGMYFNNDILTRSRGTGLAWDSNQVNVTNLIGQTLEGVQRRVTTAVYVGPSVLNAAGPGDIRAQTVEFNLPRDGDRHTLFYYDAAARAVRNAEFFVRRFERTGDIGRRKLEAAVASVQSHWLGGNLITIGGVRRDTQDTYERVDLANDGDPTTDDRLPSGEWNPAATRLRAKPSESARGTTRTWSVVAKAPERLRARLPFGADVRVFANGSENFSPAAVRRNVFNEVLAPPAGTTKEFGLMLDLPRGIFSARLNHFETAGTGFTNSALQGAVNAALNNPETLSLQRMVDAQNAGFTPAQVGLTQVGIATFDQAYAEIAKFHPEPTRGVRNLRVETVGGVRRVVGNPIEGAVGTSSFVAKGWELDLTGRPLRGLRVAFNVAQQRTVKSDIAPEFRRFAAEMRANIEKSPLRNVNDSPTQGTTVSYLARFDGTVATPLKAEVTKEGTRSLEQREWRVNVVGNYDFSGRLKGWGLGSALRWQSEVATGYPTFVAPDGIVVPDLAKPFLSGDELNGDAWLSYKRKVWSDRIAWKIQLNARNLIGASAFIPVSTNPNGSTAIVRVPPDRQWLLTNSFKF